MKWYLAALSNYLKLSGRARRREFWMFMLISTAISVGLAIAESSVFGLTVSGQSRLSALYSLAVFLPTLGVAVRRMHDAGHSGIWLIVPIAGFVIPFFDSEPHENRFGPDPKAAERPMIAPPGSGGMS